MVASSLYMVISRINIFNNTAQFGGEGSLVVIVDPLLPFCKLYDGTVQHDYITPPPETIITTDSEPTEPMVTTIQTITSALVSGQVETDKIVVISIVVSLIAILLFVTIIVLMICIYKKGPLKNIILSRMKGFSINPSHTSRMLKLHTSPIYNPNSSEDEDDTDAL